MRAFLDFEASSLKKNSYPVEVAWAFEDGRCETYLIRPAADWTDWDAKAESIHGISRDTLLREGLPVDEVARHLVEGLEEHQIYASAPSWDGKWLSLLLRTAALPRHLLRLRDTEEAREEAVREVLAPAVPAEGCEAAVSSILAEVETYARAQPVRHRALPDAQHELHVWQESRRRAEAFVAVSTTPSSCRT